MFCGFFCDFYSEFGSRDFGFRPAFSNYQFAAFYQTMSKILRLIYACEVILFIQTGTD